MAKQQGQTREHTRISFDEPDMYLVKMHNDDFTTMDFVVMVLCTVFFKSETEANSLMMTIHQTGMAIVGIYPFDIALSKSEKAQNLAKANGFPLRLSIERE
ncbi:MAG: ATP-dependent Clp protease adaptor ClpS [Muribaculaceae bacterium]